MGSKRIEYEPYQRLREDSRLSFLKRIDDPKNKSRVGIFVCDCGSFATAVIAEVKNGHKRSCGCEARISKNKINYSEGQKLNPYSMLSFISRDEKDQRDAWFLCECGRKTKTSIAEVKRGHTKSCGCLNHVKKHGMSKTITYSTWVSMMARCFNPNHQAYDRYGGAGVEV